MTGQGVFGPVPVPIWALVLAVLAVEAVLQAGATGLVGGPEAIGWRLAALQRHGFSALHWQWLLETGRWRGPEALRLVTFPFVQQGGVQAVFVAVLILALGKAVGEVVGGWSSATLALVASALGALAAAMIWPEPVWLAGGYPAVFGLLGGFGWSAAAGRGMFEGAEQARRRRALALVALFLVLRAALGLAGQGQEAVADLTACAAGAGLASLLAPGTAGRMLARLRRR